MSKLILTIKNNIMKVLTGKQYLKAFIIESNIVVETPNKTFGIYDKDSTNTFIPTIEKCTQELVNKINFDEIPFIEAFEKWKLKREQEKERIIKETKEKEEKRIAELEERIKECNSPAELSEMFGLTQFEIASHWSDLYEGRSTNGFMVTSKEDNEIVELAASIHDWDGEFGEARRRDGENHRTFNSVCDGLEDYQKCLKDHFNGNDYFYRSKETEEEFYLEQIKEAEDIEDIKKIIGEYEELEDGYYDCNGNLEISDESLNNDELTGYCEDVYCYSFAFKFDFWNKWNKNEIEELEESEE